MASSSSVGGSKLPPAPPAATLNGPLGISTTSASANSNTIIHFLNLGFQFFFQELRSNLTILVYDNLGVVFLGPMGDPDPSEIMDFETGKIPFKNASLDLAV
jgi:hypothetical protein